MKKDWVTNNLGAVTTKIGSGATPRGGETAYRNTGISLIRSLNVHDSGFRPAKLANIDDDQAAKLSNVEVQENDVLLNITGASIARCCLAPRNFLPARVNQHVSIIRVMRDKILPSYLHYLLISNLYKERLLSIGEDGGSTRQAITKSQLQEFSIEYPKSITEQQRIVGILDEAFAGIATAKANAEKNLQNARIIFTTHLQSLIFQRGSGWQEKYLHEIAKDFGRGKSKRRPRNDPSLFGGNYPFIQTGDISNSNHFLANYSQTYNEVGLAQSKLWPKGTICIAIVGATVGESAILDFEACFPDSVIGIVVNEDFADNEYVEYLIQSFKSLLKEKGKGTARDNINLGTFDGQKFPFPILPEQKSIVHRLKVMDSETQHLESLYQQKLTALDDLKKSLLQQAFSGQL